MVEACASPGGARTVHTRKMMLSAHECGILGGRRELLTSYKTLGGPKGGVSHSNISLLGDRLNPEIREYEGIKSFVPALN